MQCCVVFVCVITTFVMVYSACDVVCLWHQIMFPVSVSETSIMLILFPTIVYETKALYLYYA